MNIYKDTKNKILDALYQNFNNLNENIKNKVTCEQPKNQKFGDVSSNVILVVSKILKLDKKDISEILIKTLIKNKYIDKAEFAEPGFLNLYFSNEFWLNFAK